MIGDSSSIDDIKLTGESHTSHPRYTIHMYGTSLQKVTMSVVHPILFVLNISCCCNRVGSETQPCHSNRIIYLKYLCCQ